MGLFDWPAITMKTNKKKKKKKKKKTTQFMDTLKIKDQLCNLLSLKG
jgi:hypothetical protein